jgi:hypothetical protein
MVSGEIDEGRVDEAEASFGITGDKVVPDAITRALGLEPSRSWAKGEKHQSKSGQVLTRHGGLWVVSFRDREMLGAANAQVVGIAA